MCTPATDAFKIRTMCATLANRNQTEETQKWKYITLLFRAALPTQGEELQNPRTKKINSNVKYYKIWSSSGSVHVPMLRKHVAHCTIRPRGHNGTLPPKSARSYSHAPSGEAFDLSYHPPLLVWPPPGDYRSEPFGPGLLNRDSQITSMLLY